MNMLHVKIQREVFHADATRDILAMEASVKTEMSVSYVLVTRMQLVKTQMEASAVSAILVSMTMKASVKT